MWFNVISLPTEGSWGYKRIWLMGQNPVRLAENQMTAKGEGCGEGRPVNCGAEDQPKSLLKNLIPADRSGRAGGPQPDLPERSSCKLVLRVLSFVRAPWSLQGWSQGSFAASCTRGGDSLPDTRITGLWGTPLRSWERVTHFFAWSP